MRNLQHGRLSALKLNFWSAAERFILLPIQHKQKILLCKTTFNVITDLKCCGLGCKLKSPKTTEKLNQFICDAYKDIVV